MAHPRGAFSGPSSSADEPINATIAILTALWAWNDFLLPLIILTDQSNQTIPLAQYVFSSQFATNYPMHSPAI